MIGTAPKRGEAICADAAGTIFGIDDSGEIESVVAVNSGAVSSTDGAAG
ncbi:hypothetical protein [uncultured Campylobacter sp.]|nr:hypothetical protein [uncultured Campylobacter sp.]